MTKAKALPSKEMLNDLLDYDPASGALKWKARPLSYFHDGGHGAAHNRDKWNGRYAGKQAFTCVGEDGYYKGSIENHNARAHRIIWKMVTGEEADTIGHIDGDRLNNSWTNLRSVEMGVNAKNKARQARFTNPHVGVRKNKYGWQAYVNVNRKFIGFGTFKTLEEAIEARKIGQELYEFHANHGQRVAAPTKGN